MTQQRRKIPPQALARVADIVAGRRAPNPRPVPRAAKPPSPAKPAAGNADLMAYAALAGATLLWTGNFTVGRAISGEIAPLSLNFLRWALAILLFTPVGLPLLVAHWDNIKRDALWVIGLGASGVAAFQTLVYYGVAATPVLNAVLIIAATPAIILFVNAFLARSTPRAVQLIGASFSLAGAITLIVRGDLDRLMSMALGPADVIMLAAAATWAGYTLLLRNHPKDTPPAAALYASMIAGLALLTPFAAPELISAPPALDRWDVLGAVAYVAIFASLAAFALWTYGVRRIGPVRAGLFLNLMPLWAAVLGLTLLGEHLEPYHGPGAALVLLGVLLVNRPAKTET